MKGSFKKGLVALQLVLVLLVSTSAYAGGTPLENCWGDSWLQEVWTYVINGVLGVPDPPP